MITRISALLVLVALFLSVSPGIYAQSKSKTEKAGEKAARVWEKTKEKSKETWNKGKKEAAEFGKGWKNERKAIKEEKRKN